ncbi:MAG TPA: hypothetical protein PKV88_05110 [Bacteroidales bacterium]|jgi:hypothetical protein|nr:hypothetical protein [Bacteroidales bacterium]MDY0084825.1 hypothetical protein [Bacteroidales bacterium]HPE43440.1 hypothetical protein [Bacteroidales bacterium]
MKTKNVLIALGTVMMFVMFTTSSCKKKSDPEPEPTPTPYNPVFSATSIAIDATTIDFYISCTTDDYELIKVEVKSPGSLQDDTYMGNGMILIRDEPITFPNFFVRTSGTWKFIITGTIRSGAHIGESFTVTTTVTVSGK